MGFCWSYDLGKFQFVIVFLLMGRPWFLSMGSVMLTFRFWIYRLMWILVPATSDSIMWIFVGMSICLERPIFVCPRRKCDFIGIHLWGICLAANMLVTWGVSSSFVMLGSFLLCLIHCAVVCLVWLMLIALLLIWFSSICRILKLVSCF